MNLWPAFRRVWAPEEVFLPTALSLCGLLDEVSTRRALTHSRWDARAADHRDRAHPFAYDGHFDDRLVSRVRREGCLFLRKLKRSLDVSLWERIVVQRQKGGQASEAGSARATSHGPEQDMAGEAAREPTRRREEREIRGRKRESGHGHHGEMRDSRSRHHSHSARYDPRRGHHYDSRSSARKRQR